MSHGPVSVVIPARGALRLQRTVASLAEQEPKGAIAEILVVGDSVQAEGGRGVPLRSIPTPAPVTSPVARNIGIRAARTEWIAFLDADCVAAPDWVTRLLSAADKGHAVIGGGVAFGRSAYWADVHNVSMLHDYHVSLPAGPRQFLPTLNLLVRRDVISAVGLMDEGLRRAQDLEWTARMYRQGISPWFEPRAVVTHFPERHAGSLWQDYFETGQTSYRVRKQRADSLSIPARLRSPWLLRLLSPAIAAAATARIFVKVPALLRHLPDAPGIWFTKLAWCLGAAAACEEQER